MLSCESSSTIADVRASVVCAAAYSFVNSLIRLFTNFRLVGSSMAVHVSPAHAFERRKIKDLIGAFGDLQHFFTALFSPCLADHCFHVFFFEWRYHRRQSKRLDSKTPAHRMPMDARQNQRSKLIPRITQPPCQRFVDLVSARYLIF
jgi:hypothetical protein